MTDDSRPGEPDSVADAYAGDRYQRLTLTGDPSSTGHRVLHRLLEAGESSRYHPRVLEVGANRGEHLTHVRHRWDEYVMVDLEDRRSDQDRPAGARFVVADAHDLPFPDARFDRTVMTCVLHHLDDPETALRELRRATKPEGRISILIPTDPGLAYRAVRAATSGRRARRDGVAAEQRLSHARQHRNLFASLLTMARSVFAADDIVERYFPLPIRTWNANPVTVLRIRRGP